VAALFALLSSAMWGGADYLGGRLTRRQHVLVVLGASQAVGLLAMVAAMLLTRAWTAPTGYIGWAVLASLAGGTGLAMYYRALSIGTMGVVSPIAALGVLVPLAVGLIDGERPTGLQFAGILVALVGVVAASGPEVHGEAGWSPVLLAGGSALFLGTSLLAISRGSQYSAVMTMTGMRVVTVTLLLVGALVLRPAVRATPAEIPGFAAVGLLDVGANMAFGYASTLGLLTLVSVLGSLFPVATILLARWLDHERLRPVQVAGVALALTGVAAIATG
jgi:drug/metabolite transporter (DMT)-like permease